MKFFAYINWVVLVLLFSAVAFRGVDGLDKSFDNNYFAERPKQGVNPLFSANAKILTTLLLNDDIAIDSFPFGLFTHIIVDASLDHQTLYHFNRPEKLIKEKDRIKSGTELLVNIHMDHVLKEHKNNKILERAYLVLDSLKEHIPGSEPGLVFEAKAGDDLKGKLKALKSELRNKGKGYKNYLCVYFERLSPSMLENIDDAPELLQPMNYGGLLIKPFRTIRIPGEREIKMKLPRLYDNMNDLMEHFLQNKKEDVDNTFFCFPTVLMFDNYSDAVLEQYSDFIALVEDTTSSEQKLAVHSGHVVTDSTKYNIKCYKYFYTVDRIDTITAAFEDQATLASKIEFAAQHGINPGFWNVNSVVTLPNPEAQTKNPVYNLFSFARGLNFRKPLKAIKKLLKDAIVKPVFEKKLNRQSNLQTPVNWYWPTLEAHLPKQKKPDYLLFLFTPLFVYKILMPVFIILYFSFVNSKMGDLFLKPLRVSIFNITVSGYRLLFLDIFFWLVVLFLFLIYWFDDKDGIGYTMRNFAILLLMAVALGRPIIKFLIKFLKLFAKPFKIRKLIKILPYLGEVFYYSITDEEKEKAVNYIATKDKDRYVYADSQQDDSIGKSSMEQEEDKRYKRARDFFEGDNYTETESLEKQRDIQKSQDQERIDKKGEGEIGYPFGLIIFFQFLLIGISMFLVLFFELYMFGGINEITIDDNYILIAAIFLIELVVIASFFFKEYYFYSLTKLFARHV